MSEKQPAKGPSMGRPGGGPGQGIGKAVEKPKISKKLRSVCFAIYQKKCGQSY